MNKTDSDSGLNRRGLLKAGISALAAGLLLKFVGSDEVIVKKVYGADGSAVIIGGGNTGSNTTTLSSPVANGSAAYFVNSGTGDAQAIQGNMTGTAGRAFVGYASAASGSTIALDGVCNSPSGIGLRGANTATSGNAIGVQGSTESPTGAIFLGKGPGAIARIMMQQDSVKFKLASPNNIIEGYEGNSITAGVIGGTISGGGASALANMVTDDYGTVGGGYNNRAGDNAGTTTDRPYATVGGGGNNIASGSFSTVDGGWGNSASGYAATVGGGYTNYAVGDYSFAAGRRSYIAAAHDGAFLFADQNDFTFNSSAANEFAVRCTGGARFVSGIDGSGNPNAGVSLAAGGTSWGTICDRNLKENFTSVDGQSILERLSSIPVTQWNMKSQNSSIRHMGPMAQDFYTAFGLGEDDRHITTVDADGVALVAIQGLNLKLEEKIKEQTQVIEELRVQLQRLEQSFKLNLPFAVA